MSTTATTPLTSQKVLPRLECSVCGQWHSDGTPETTVDMDISGNKNEPARKSKTLFNQCAKCLEEHGSLKAVLHKPYEHNIGYFEKNPNTAVTLLGTGPTDD